MADHDSRRLAISLVVHEWRVEDIYPGLESLAKSLRAAHDEGLLGFVALYIVYNGEDILCVDQISQELRGVFPFSVTFLPVQRNQGYGQANNVLLDRLSFLDFDLALVMNPDVLVGLSAVSFLVRQLLNNPGAGLVVPRLLDPVTGKDVYGCKRYPSLLVLAVRQFRFLQRFRSLLRLNDRYEYRDLRPDNASTGVELCSGCFLMASLRFWQDLDGFDSRYFMYFEDFDLSLRGTARGWEHIYEPAAHVMHAGGGAARKPMIHRWWFVRSAFRFFLTHGWRIRRVGRGRAD